MRDNFSRALSIVEVFWSKVARAGPDDCWNWTGAVNSQGQGVVDFRIEGRYGPRLRMSASRFAYQITHGPVDPDLNVCHTCDNKLCCNNAHLWLGTQVDNLQDMTSKGRRATGERAGSSKLSNDEVLAIRQAVADGLTQGSQSRLYGISRASISDIILRKTYKEI
jgi:hypothetical protein